MDAEPETTTLTPPGSIFSLARLALILIPVLSFIGYYAPYLIGLAYHQHLLNLYDVHAGLFESEPRELFVFAYEAILVISGKWLVFIIHSYVIPLVFFCVLLFSLEMTAIVWLTRSTKLNGAVSRNLKSRWAQLGLAFLMLSLAVTGFVAAFPVAIYPLIALPTNIGSFGAQLTFDREQELFKSGCGVENASHIYCKAIVDNDKVIAVGFEIVTSDNRIALYQPKQTKILKLGDAVIEVMRPEDFRRYEASLPKP